MALIKCTMCVCIRHTYLHAYAPRFKVLLMLMRFIYGLNHISLFCAFIYLLICVYPSQVSVAVLGCWNSSVQLTHYYVFVFVAWLPEGLNVLNLNDFSNSAVVLFACVFELGLQVHAGNIPLVHPQYKSSRRGYSARTGTPTGWNGAEGVAQYGDG